MTTASTTARHVTVRCQFCLAWNRIDAGRAADRPKCGKCARPILLDRPLSLDEETFARTIADSEVPVLVDFYADWCGPCKMMAPFVDELARRHLGSALVVKVNTDLAVRTSESFQIRGIPTTIVFHRGREAARRVGALRLQELEQLLAEAPRD